MVEKIAMFIHVFGHKCTNREVQERFEHSGDTISWFFQQVLKASLFLHVGWVQLPPILNIIPDYITSNPNFTPYCIDCLGALDGIHIPVHISSKDCRSYQNQGRCLIQNILATCNFEVHFCYILPGWEGYAHDIRIFKDAIDRKGFVVPVGKYYYLFFLKSKRETIESKVLLIDFYF